MRQSIAGIVYNNGKFLIGRRLPVGEMACRWEFPGGKVDPGETPEQAISREFREELGIEVIVSELLTSAQFINKKGPSNLLAYRIHIPAGSTFELTEHTEMNWASLEEIQTLEFVDSDRLLLPFLETWVKQ